MAGKIPTQNFIEEYRVLYHAFHQLNRLCWQNRLPLCQIEIFSRRGRMAHEMTHIWQYEKGERGGHRADFKN